MYSNSCQSYQKVKLGVSKVLGLRSNNEVLEEWADQVGGAVEVPM